MLISKTVKVKWNPSVKKYYISLGYKYTKMKDEFEVRVDDLPQSSRTKVTIQCDKCGTKREWTYQDYNKYVKENGKTYCKKCSIILFGKQKEKNTRLKNGNSFYDWCIKNNRQDLLDRWDYELNGCSPKEVLYGSNEKYWFKCLEHLEHKSELRKLIGLCQSNSETKCSQCNSIAQWFIDNNLDIKDYWDYERNGDLDPWEVNKGGVRKIWIKCQKKDYHGSYETMCCNFTKGARCPYCKGFKVHPKDSIGQYIIDNYGEEFLWKIWSDKNEKSPFEYSCFSPQKTWWKCLDNKHKDYLRYCYNSTYHNFRCPECSKMREESIIEEKTRLYLKELGYEVKTEYKCSLLIKNPKTNYPLPYDNEVVLENGKHLIIEVHGSQHYYIQNKFMQTNKTPEEYLHQRKLYDRYKRIKCIQVGYEYLEIPYTAFDKKETYKNLIDNKIKEILDELE